MSITLPSGYGSPACGDIDARDRGIATVRAHSTPDPDADPPPPNPNPDNIPPPVNAPVKEPSLPEPPIKAAAGAAR